MFYKEGTTALHKACEANAVKAVELMIESYVASAEEKAGSSAVALKDVLGCRTDSNQATPLLTACGSGALDVVELLLKKGSNPLDMENSYGSMCLHLAARSGSPSASAVCQRLLDAGAPVSVANNRGAHPLHFSLSSKPESEAVKVIEVLASSPGVDMNAQDLEGNTALHAASTMVTHTLHAMSFTAPISTCAMDIILLCVDHMRLLELHLMVTFFHLV